MTSYGYSCTAHDLTFKVGCHECETAMQLNELLARAEKAETLAAELFDAYVEAHSVADRLLYADEIEAFEKRVDALSRGEAE